MLDHTLDAENSILFIRPRSSLSKSDFEALTKTVDEHLATGGALDGIIIEAPGFPDGRASVQWQLIFAL